jgi:aldehyde dehydrogenase (NAD+)
VTSYLNLARQDGGTFLAGGDPADDLGPGYFVKPAVVAGLPAESRVLRDEIFGPVAALIPASSYDEALSLANDTPFGLTAALFTRDLERALRFAREARAGVVKVNQETAGLEFQAPFGGMGESSSGSREQGKVAREFFTQWKTVYIDTPPA